MKFNSILDRPATKFQIIQALEGTWLPLDKWRPIVDGKLYTEFGWFNLLNYEIGTLERWLDAAVKEVPVDPKIKIVIPVYRFN